LRAYKLFTLILSISLFFPSDMNLGRNNDPKVPSDISSLNLAYRKAIWSTLSIPGQRFMSKFLFPISSISYMNADNAIALTIDDGFCGIDNPDGCMINEVRELFKKYNAKATFFITGSHCTNVTKSEVLLLLNDGHELANHNMYDYAYDKHNAEEFSKDLDKTDEIISSFTSVKTKWYRAPHAKLSDTMQLVLEERSLIHVISDSFANDTAIPDSEWISEFILKHVQPGSIIVIHMPERGVREWLYEAMELTLIGLKNKNLEVLNLTQLEALQIN